VRKFAQHFIFWRRAIAIPPLHARDIYILSPNCDLSRLPQAAARWARQFPLAPALPNFLADLSVAPRPYKIHCPSKAHRPLYMTMLAWLMRGGWVTQLCTFAYVVVWPEIIYEVEYALEAEAIAKARRAETQGGEPSSLDSTNTASSSSNTTTTGGGGDPDDDPSSPTASRNQSLSSPTGLGLGLAIPNPSSDLASSSATLRSLAISEEPTSPSTVTTAAFPSHSGTPSRTSSSLHLSQHHHHHHHHHTPTPAEAAAEKARLERLASRAARDLADKATAHARKQPPRATAHPSVNTAPHLAGLSPHVVLDAKKATGRESLYLDAIARRLLRRDLEPRLVGEGEPEGDAEGGRGKMDGPTAGENDNRGEMPTTSFHAARSANVGGTSSRAQPGGGASRHRGGGVGGMGAGPGGRDSQAGGGGGKDWDERVAAAWPVFWKYFNGRCALERIALQEDMKRKDAWNLLTGMSEYLLTVRHW